MILCKAIHNVIAFNPSVLTYDRPDKQNLFSIGFSY